MAISNMETVLTDDQSQQTSARQFAQPKERQMAPSAIGEPSVRDMAQLFKLLADETRLRILMHLLAKDELHVRALCELLEQSQPAVSHHLALLRVANLIESRRDGKHNYYRVIDKQVKNLVGKMGDDLPYLPEPRRPDEQPPHIPRSTALALLL